jgi:hypothetical protein
MQTVQRSTEQQLTQDISGLNSQLEVLDSPSDLSARRAASFLRQIIKSKVNQRATLRYMREQVDA